MELNEKQNDPKNRKPRQVQTKCGTVEGIRLRCEKGPIDAFLGIPYAKPPIGERRFKVNLFCDPLKLHQLTTLNGGLQNTQW